MRRKPAPREIAPGAGAKAHIRKCFRTLWQAWGPQHWWPAQTPFEVIVGAYLTQNTSWTNVERALQALRRARLLSVAGIRRTPVGTLAATIRSAGYFRQKAQRLKRFVDWLDEAYGGSLERMFSEPTGKLRDELLALNGVGPETADSILLYAGHHPVFVVDAYTRRIFERHQLLAPAARYQEVRRWFEEALRPAGSALSRSPSPAQARSGEFRPPVHSPSAMSLAPRSSQAQTLAEMHGLIVQTGKHFCLKQAPACERCPLRIHLPALSPLRSLPRRDAVG